MGGHQEVDNVLSRVKGECDGFCLCKSPFASQRVDPGEIGRVASEKREQTMSGVIDITVADENR